MHGSKTVLRSMSRRASFLPQRVVALSVNAPSGIFPLVPWESGSRVFSHPHSSRQDQDRAHRTAGIKTAIKPAFVFVPLPPTGG